MYVKGQQIKDVMFYTVHSSVFNKYGSIFCKKSNNVSNI